MQITSKMSLPLTNWRKENADDKEGVREVVVLKPGVHDYKGIDHKDPRVAEQLRVWRKHEKISFEELLPSDVKILKKLKGSPQEKAEQLKAAVSLKPFPIHRMKPTEKMKEKFNAGRTAPNSPAAEKVGEKKGSSKGSR